MNIIFLCSLICLSSSSLLNHLAPLKKITNKSLIDVIANTQLLDVIMDHQKDPAYLLSVLSNVDPTQLNAVIVLIRALLADSETDLAALTLASTNANVAYTDATAAYDTAVLARGRLGTAYTDENVRRETAYTAQSAVLDQQVNDLFVVKTEAHGAKTNAQGTLDTEKIRLNGEIATLKQVITLLEGLGDSTSGECLINSVKVGDAVDSTNGAPYICASDSNHANGYYPICGHHLWNNNFGADLICKAAGFVAGSMSDWSKLQYVYNVDSFWIGDCRASDNSFATCASVNHQKYGNGGGYGFAEGTHHGSCSSGNKVGFHVECTG